MSQRSRAVLAAIFCVAVFSAGMTASAADFGVAPTDFGLAPGEPAPLPPPAQYGTETEETLYQAALAPVAPATLEQLPPNFVPPPAQRQLQYAQPQPYPAQQMYYAPQYPGQMYPAQAPERIVPYGAVVPAGMGEPTGNFLPGAPPPAVSVIAPPPAPGFVPAPAIMPVPAPAYAPAPAAAQPVYTDPNALRTAAPDLYASLAATVTAAAGDPSIPVVVRPATTAQAMDAAGAPVNLAGLAAAGTPVVDWSAAVAGAPYPVETPGQPGMTTYVVPIQVPVRMDGTDATTQAAPVPPVGAPVALPPPPQATPFVSFIQPGQTEAAPPWIAAPQQTNPFANIVAVTPGAQPVVPTATAGAGVPGQGGVFYYGTNPVSIASAIGMQTADGAEYLDFGAISSGAINLVTTAQIKQALARQTPLAIIDVRGDLVREIEGHVPGDINISFDNPASFAANVARAVPDRNIPVVVYCQDGVWSSHAADVLLAMGYKTFLMGSYRLW